MKYQKIAKILSIIVMAVGAMVMIGWILDIQAFKSILPQFVTMKFTTAISFVLSGVILYFTAKVAEGKGEIAQVMLPIAALVIFLLMATLLGSIFLNIRTGIEDLFVKEQIGAVKTTTPGRPSIGTMLDFLLIASIALITMFRPLNLKKYLCWIGSIIGFIGLVAVAGYIIGVPLLYYTYANISTAMALHTAILFTLLGIGFVALGKNAPSENPQ